MPRQSLVTNLLIRSGVFFSAVLAASVSSGAGSESQEHDADSPSQCVLATTLTQGKGADMPQLHGLQAEVMLDHQKEDQRRYRLARSPASIGGQSLDDTPATQRRRWIAGPVEMRSSPNGKVIETFPEGLTVLLEGVKGEWSWVRGYWEHPCSTGWVPSKNLRLKPESS